MMGARLCLLGQTSFSDLLRSLGLPEKIGIRFACDGQIRRHAAFPLPLEDILVRLFIRRTPIVTGGLPVFALVISVSEAIALRMFTLGS